MKKSILATVIVLSAFSIMAIGYMNRTNEISEPETTKCEAKAEVNNDHLEQILKQNPEFFHYEVDSRFGTTISLADLHNAKTIRDLLPEDATAHVKSFSNVRISHHRDGWDPSATGENNTLSPQQLNLIREMGYSSCFHIEANYKRKNPAACRPEGDLFVYFVTITPEKEVQYEGGMHALKNYLVSNSAEVTAGLNKDQLKPGKVRFTITKEGSISNVQLESTCGYDNVDQAMIKLVSNAPKKWTPAQNSNGKNVSQELVFSYGQMGC